jgi:hypothetical protein
VLIYRLCTLIQRCVYDLSPFTRGPAFEVILSPLAFSIICQEYVPLLTAR